MFEGYLPLLIFVVAFLLACGAIGYWTVKRRSGR